MNRVVIMSALFLFSYGCNKSKEEKAFEEFNSGVSLSLAAQTEMSNGNFELAEKLNRDAISKFETTLVINPNHKGVHSALGHSYYLVKEYKKGIDVYEKAIRIDSTMAISYLESAFCEIYLGDIVSGRSSIQNAIKLDSTVEFKNHALYSLYDIGQLIFNQGEQFHYKREFEKRNEFRKFGVNILYVAYEIDSNNVELNQKITDFSNIMRSGNSIPDN